MDAVEKTNGTVGPVAESVKIVEQEPPAIAKILIGVSILSYSHEFVQSFLSLWTQLCTTHYPKGRVEVGFRFAYRRPVHMAQEELAQFAVDTGCTHILLMDDDIYDVKAEDIFKLLEADKEVIGGVMFTSKFPHAMCAFRRYDLKTRIAEQPILDGPARLYEIPPEQCIGVQECDLIPFGLTLIKTSVFSAIEKPWFHCDTQAPTDSWFMDSIMDKGLKPYVSFDVWLNHAGCNRVTRPFMVQMGMELARQISSKVIILTQEEMSRHMLTMDMKMKDSEKQRVEIEKGEAKFLTVK